MSKCPRWLGLALGSLFVVGCGFASYEQRLELTVNRIRDEATINSTLGAPIGGTFEKAAVFVRPPTKMRKIAEGNLTGGLFDVEAAYSEPAATPPPGQGQQGQPPAAAQGPRLQLLLLSRKKSEGEPKKAQGKNEGETQQAPRGDFEVDLKRFLADRYGVDPGTIKFDAVTKTIWPRSNPARSLTYQRSIIQQPEYVIQVYRHAEKSGKDEYDTAFVWEIPRATEPELSRSTTSPIDLALGTFAVGPKAARRYRGEVDESEGGGGEVEVGADATAF